MLVWRLKAKVLPQRLSSELLRRNPNIQTGQQTGFLVMFALSLSHATFCNSLKMLSWIPILIDDGTPRAQKMEAS